MFNIPAIIPNKSIGLIDFSRAQRKVNSSKWQIRKLQSPGPPSQPFVVTEAQGLHCRGEVFQPVDRMMGEAILTMSAVEPGNSSACASADGEEHQPYSLLCRVGSQLCAVPLDRVIEVMRMLPIKPVRKAPHYVRGLCIIRGAPVLVIDTGLLIGNRATDCERLITVRAGDRTIALAAETVLGIWAIGADILRRLPPLLGDAATDTIAAIGSRDAELLYVLRLARIVPDDLVDQLTVEGAQL